jgi:hypothetical protein
MLNMVESVEVEEKRMESEQVKKDSKQIKD